MASSAVHVKWSCFRYFVTGRFLRWLLMLNENHAFLPSAHPVRCSEWPFFSLVDTRMLWPVFIVVSNCPPYPNKACFLHTQSFETLHLWNYRTSACHLSPWDSPSLPSRASLPCYPNTHSSIFSSLYLISHFIGFAIIKHFYVCSHLEMSSFHIHLPPAWFMVTMLTSVIKQNERDHLALWLWRQRLGSLAVITLSLQGKQWGLTIYGLS